jgi:F420-dependent oxidoreductase-like protein
VTAIGLASHEMRLGLALGYAPPGTNPTELIALAQEAERLGYDSAWAAEAWGTDAVTVLSWLAAKTTTLKVGSSILQMPARTPAMTAMTAATLDLMSGGRFLLGLGTSGPQVVEGWHGQPWGKPLAKTREYVEIVRSALRREELQHDGEHYGIPYDGEGATGLGKPLKMMLRPLRADVPIYLAAMGPKNVALAAEIADGWLLVWGSGTRFRDTFGPSLEEGFARGGRDPSAFDVAAWVPVVVTDDLELGYGVVKPQLALYVGGMGARGQNFYNSLIRRYGYEAEADRIQSLYLDGKKREAAEAVPDALADEVSLIGPRDRIAERLDAWRESGVTTLMVSARDLDSIRTMAELAL